MHRRSVGGDSVTCLTGVSSTGRTQQVDVGSVNRSLVLGNESVFGSVNANRGHYEAAVTALEQADTGWLQRLVTRRVALADFQDAFRRQDTDVKVVVEIQAHRRGGNRGLRDRRGPAHGRPGRN
jgi:threonine dehydrogenase-like Zn-dependent dehydrogenase